MTLNLAIAMNLYGLLRPGDLPEVAVLAMTQGHDSPSMVRLAGELPKLASPAELRELFDRALLETAISYPPPLEAGRLLVRHYAGQIVAGELAPRDGVGMIYCVCIEAERQCQVKKGVAEHLGIGTLMDVYYRDEFGAGEATSTNAAVIAECARVIAGPEGQQPLAAAGPPSNRNVSWT